MMKVLYDSNIFDYQQYGGVSKCFCEVFNHYPANVKFELPIKITKNVHLLESGIVRDSSIHRILTAMIYSLKKLRLEKPTILAINRDYNIKVLSKGEYDVFHHTFSDDYFLPYIGDKPFIYTIHDMIPELYPEFFNMDDHWIQCRKLLCEKATKIVAISENTKNDLVRIFGIDPGKVIVIHHGGPKKRSIVEKPIINTPYFLFVGSRIKYKNFSTLLEAFAVYNKEHKDFKLICTGRLFNKEEQSFIENNGLQGSVVQMYVSDAELLNLYSNATAFIYPSLYEGFGLPILEAFSCGCPTILSECSCFPEIGGEAALYFNANENAKENLLKQLEYVASLNVKERNEIVKRGYDRLNTFTWEASAEKLCNVYKSVL